MRMTEERSIQKYRAERIRDIILAGVGTSPAGDLPDDFRSGDSITLKSPGRDIVGRVTFNLKEIQVTMPSPFRCSSRTIFAGSIHSRNLLTQNGCSDGPATMDCISRAVGILRDLYCDMILLIPKADELNSRLQSLQKRMSELEKEDRRRRSELLDTLKPLNRISHTLKQSFNGGELTQEEYVSIKEPIKDRIGSCLNQMKPTDFFQMEFIDISGLCRVADLSEELFRELGAHKEG